MRHLVLLEYGQFIGLSSARAQVRKDKQVLSELPLSRLRSITIAKPGIGLSSDLILACAARGIRLYFTDFRGAQLAALMGSEQHATVAVRKRQLAFVSSVDAPPLATRIVQGKLANQRALLRYFAKYHEKLDNGPLGHAAARLAEHRSSCGELNLNRDNWRFRLLGHEGDASSAYFGAFRQAGLFPGNFTRRVGRGATDPVNAALNLGYTILLTRLWTTLSNAGLECYAGVLHEDRPGKPSLVLDVMEEHRPFIVDRTVLTLRQALGDVDTLDTALRRRVIEGVSAAFDRKMLHRGRKLRVETIMQRQAYRLAGHFAGEQTYRPTRYKW